MELAIRNIFVQSLNEVREEVRAERQEGDRKIKTSELIDRLFVKLFPNTYVPANYEVENSDSETESVKSETKVIEVPASEVKEKKKRASSKPKLDENGNPIPKKSRVKKVAEEKPAVVENTTVVENATEGVEEVKTDSESVSSKSSEKKKRSPPKPKLDENGNPIPKKPRTKKVETTTVEEVKTTTTEEVKNDSDNESVKTTEDKPKVDKKKRGPYKKKSTETVAEVKTTTTQPVETVEQESIEVEFEGQIYYVTPNDKKVWKEEGEAHVLAGYVGMAKFEKLVVPELD